MYGLVDCNSFFCSCEQVFRPDLREKPVVVLSNNDGCIVALTTEAKAVGLKRGMPIYQVQNIIEKYDVAVFSSNYTLYGDMSARVMSILAENVDDIDIYSIDEAFLHLDGFEPPKLESFARELHRKVIKGTGIPVSVGIASTKTLAKVAAKFAKQYKAYKGVCIIDSEEKRVRALQLFDVTDVWGVGRRFGKRLMAYGIRSAWDLTQKPESWIKSEMSITGVRTWRELRGQDCIDIEELPEKKSICTSRSFSQMTDNLADLTERVSNFASKTARKLREQHSVCQTVTVFILSNHFRDDLAQYDNSLTVKLPVATADTAEIIRVCSESLKSIYREHIMYKKAGVVVSNISSDRAIQQDLFDPVDRQKQRRLNTVVDAINRKVGYETIHSAAQGVQRKEWLKREFISKNYTTNIKDIIQIRLL
jgi:DNA polymerase V